MMYQMALYGNKIYSICALAITFLFIIITIAKEKNDERTRA